MEEGEVEEAEDWHGESGEGPLEVDMEVVSTLARVPLVFRELIPVDAYKFYTAFMPLPISAYRYPSPGRIWVTSSQGHSSRVLATPPPHVLPNVTDLQLFPNLQNIFVRMPNLCDDGRISRTVQLFHGFPSPLPFDLTSTLSVS